MLKMRVDTHFAGRVASTRYAIGRENKAANLGLSAKVDLFYHPTCSLL